MPCPFPWDRVELVSSPPGDPRHTVGLMASLRAQLAVNFNLVTWTLLSKTHRKCSPGLPWRHAPQPPRVPQNRATAHHREGTRNDSSSWASGGPLLGPLGAVCPPLARGTY